MPMKLLERFPNLKIDKSSPVQFVCVRHAIPQDNFEEHLAKDLRATASFVEHIAHCHQDVLIEWMRTHPDSDFVKWLRSFEHAGI